METERHASGEKIALNPQPVQLFTLFHRELCSHAFSAVFLSKDKFCVISRLYLRISLGGKSLL